VNSFRHFYFNVLFLIFF